MRVSRLGLFTWRWEILAIERLALTRGMHRSNHSPTVIVAPTTTIAQGLSFLRCQALLHATQWVIADLRRFRGDPHAI